MRVRLQPSEGRREKRVGPGEKAVQLVWRGWLAHQGRPGQQGQWSRGVKLASAVLTRGRCDGRYWPLQVTGVERKVRMGGS